MASYYIPMTPSEMFKFFFYRKICSKCGTRLERRKDTKFLEHGEYSMNGVIYKGNKYEVHIDYYCKSCNKVTKISELGNKKSSKKAK